MGFLDLFFGKKKEKVKQKKQTSVGIAFGEGPTFAERYAETGDITFLHFDIQERIEFNYKNRSDKISYDKAKKLCYDMIEIAPEVAAKMEETNFMGDRGIPLPRHHGYQQLAIILQKEGVFTEAIRICEKGEKEGWNNDFAKRIERLKKKL